MTKTSASHKALQIQGKYYSKFTQFFRTRLESFEMPNLKAKGCMTAGTYIPQQDKKAPEAGLCCCTGLQPQSLNPHPKHGPQAPGPEPYPLTQSLRMPSARGLKTSTSSWRACHHPIKGHHIKMRLTYLDSETDEVCRIFSILTREPRISF